ncbi:hypothetical protein BDA99DRAFT_496051 [Phascolomyces articulosus]|uniref:Uncharacterized protein n=1 Tax=Phascolomyces articulosus TaxID=60185 RepID=A0AAD5KLL8_9FUNG|nr:hypothetical protein BDA99DRAFT_496051 [Phascolomyces articulosus]
MITMSKNKPTLRTTGMVTTVAMTMVNALQAMAQDNFDDPLDMGNLDTTDSSQEQSNENEDDEEVEEETWDDDVDSLARTGGDRSQNMDEDASVQGNDNDDEEEDDHTSIEEEELPQPEIIGTLDTKDTEPPTDYAPEVLDVAGNEDEEDTFEVDEEEDEEQYDEDKQQKDDDEALKQELAEEDSRQKQEQDFRNNEDDEAMLNQQLVEEEYSSHDGMVIDPNDIMVDTTTSEEEELDTTEEDGVTDKQEPLLPPPPTYQQQQQQIEEKHDLDQELANEGFEEEEEIDSQSDALLSHQVQQPPTGNDVERIKDWQTNDEKQPFTGHILNQNEWAEGSEEEEEEDALEQDEADLSDLTTKPQPNDMIQAPTEPEFKGNNDDTEEKERMIQAPLLGVPPIDDNKVAEQYDQTIDNSLEKALEMDAANVPWYDDSNAKNEDLDLLINKENPLSEEQLTQGQQPGIVHSDTAPAFATADQKSGYRSSSLMLLIVVFMILFILRKRWLKIITRQKNSTSLPFYRNPYSKQSLD